MFDLLSLIYLPLFFPSFPGPPFHFFLVCHQIIYIYIMMKLTGQPFVPVGVVWRDGSLTVLEDINGLRRSNDNWKTRRNTQALLRTTDDDIQVPLIETDFFRTNGADTINNNQGFRRDRLDNLSDALNVRQNASAKLLLIVRITEWGKYKITNLRGRFLFSQC